MNDNSFYTLLVLGGTSKIATAYVRQRLKSLKNKKKQLRVILVGRTLEKLEAEAKNFNAHDVKCDIIVSDLSLVDIKNVLGCQPQDINEVILAYGLLTQNKVAQKDASYLKLHLNTNFVSAVLWLEALSQYFEKQGHGNVLIIGSVAGDRGRQSNYAYGAAKAGLATFVSGLQHRFSHFKNVHFLFVKPGFVDSSMTAHITPKGALWTKPEKIAKVLEKALLKKRYTIYAPTFWYFIMQIVRILPSFILHKTKL